MGAAETIYSNNTKDCTTLTIILARMRSTVQKRREYLHRHAKILKNFIICTTDIDWCRHG
jgi:hypothetical protein